MSFPSDLDRFGPFRLAGAESLRVPRMSAKQLPVILESGFEAESR